MNTQDTPEVQTHMIPEWNMERLNSEVAKLNRRANKIGCPEISVEIVAEHMVPDPYKIKDNMRQDAIDRLPKIKKFEIKINGEGPKIEGYRFIGTLDHNTIPGAVIVNSVPGETVPHEFFQVKALCHHCDKIRSRTETFVVFNEEACEYLQVGRNCLRDFFGHDPSVIARFLSRIISFVTDLDGEGWDGCHGGRGMTYLNSVDVLSNTIAMIRTAGWTARSAGGFEDVPTADQVQYLMTFMPRNRDEQREFKTFCDSIKHKDGDKAEALEAIEWLKTQTNDNSYIHNLQAIALGDDVPTNMLGYWCSLASSYQRAMDKLEIRKRENAKKLNEYLGEIKQRTDIDIEVVGISYTPSNYGTVTIVRMVDTDGRTLVWFANTDVEMEKGCKYKVKATIKKHEEYRDWKQTQVNRLKVIEEVATA